MTEVSNRTLAFLLVGAIVVSLFGTFISLNRLNKLTPGLTEITGLATTGSGTVQLEVSGQTSFRVEAATVDFGTIQPNSTGFWISTMSNNSWANGTAPFVNNCEDANGLCAGIEIENDGNEVINISFNTTQDASSLIGGTNPEWFFRILDGNRTGPGNDDGCNGTIPFGSWTNLTSYTLFEICNGTGNNDTGFDFEAGQDRITMEFNLTIPNDVPQATPSATILLWNEP